jgi:hypothetical protein
LQFRLLQRLIRGAFCRGGAGLFLHLSSSRGVVRRHFFIFVLIFVSFVFFFNFIALFVFVFVAPLNVAVIRALFCMDYDKNLVERTCKIELII